MNLSTEELKALNRKDDTIARTAEPTVMVTERNWSALLNLVSRLWQRQEVTEKLLNELMTYADAKTLLNTIEENTQRQVTLLQTEARSFSSQAGRMSENFSSDVERVITNTERSQERITKEALKWLRRMAIAAIASTALLTVLFGWVVLRKILPTLLP